MYAAPAEPRTKVFSPVPTWRNINGTIVLVKKCQDNSLLDSITSPYKWWGCCRQQDKIMEIYTKFSQSLREDSVTHFHILFIELLGVLCMTQGRWRLNLRREHLMYPILAMKDVYWGKLWLLNRIFQWEGTIKKMQCGWGQLIYFWKRQVIAILYLRFQT